MQKVPVLARRLSMLFRHPVMEMDMPAGIWRLICRSNLPSLKVGVKVEEGSELAQPVADDNAVYTVMPGGVVTAVSTTTGQIIWQVVMTPPIRPRPAPAAALVSRAILFLSMVARTICSPSIPANGQTLWSELPQYLLGGPTIAQGVVVVTDVDGRIYAMAASDGAQLWNGIGAGSQTSMVGVAFPAVIENEIIFAGGDGELISLSLDQGRFN